MPNLKKYEQNARNYGMSSKSCPLGSVMNLLE